MSTDYVYMINELTGEEVPIKVINGAVQTTFETTGTRKTFTLRDTRTRDLVEIDVYNDQLLLI